jgi:hypothetical protein
MSDLASIGDALTKPERVAFVPGGDAGKVNALLPICALLGHSPSMM